MTLTRWKLLAGAFGIAIVGVALGGPKCPGEGPNKTRTDGPVPRLNLIEPISTVPATPPPVLVQAVDTGSAVPVPQAPPTLSSLPPLEVPSLSLPPTPPAVRPAPPPIEPERPQIVLNDGPAPVAPPTASSRPSVDVPQIDVPKVQGPTPPPTETLPRVGPLAPAASERGLAVLPERPNDEPAKTNPPRVNQPMNDAVPVVPPVAELPKVELPQVELPKVRMPLDPPATPTLPALVATQAEIPAPQPAAPSTPAPMPPASAASPVVVGKPTVYTKSEPPAAAPELGASGEPAVTESVIHEAASGMRVVVRLGTGQPRFEVLNGDDVLLKAVCDRIDVRTATEGGDGLTPLRAAGSIRFTAPGCAGVCDTLTVYPASGEVELTGHVQVSCRQGKGETKIQATTVKFRLGSAPAYTVPDPTLPDRKPTR